MMQHNPGAVAASSPHAAKAGAQILRAGGNAVDAAVGTCLALTVADPINTSLFGRCQIIAASPGAASGPDVWAIDGTTSAPRDLPVREGPRAGFAAVPVPGLLRALAQAHRAHGRLALAEIVAPAITLAREGFIIPPALGAIWQEKGPSLGRDPAARRFYLKADGAPYGPGELFRQPALADLLTGLSHDLGALFDDPGECRALASRIADGGGFITQEDLATDHTRIGERICGQLAGQRVVTIGRQGWGHSLLQMIAILEAAGFDPEGAGFDEELALTILCALQDRPQDIATLTPKPFGLPFEILCDPDFARRRAARIADMSRATDTGARLVAAYGAPGIRADRDTTHLSVVDGEGAMVALTTSIGPHFGAGVADPVHGVLFAHSYRMASQPTPGARDVTEMTPTLVFDGDIPHLTIGGAGSERIPGAVFQVLVGNLMRSRSLSEAIAAPRCNWMGGALRLHEGHSARAHFEARGYTILESPRDHRQHLGIVQAVARDGMQVVGAADPAYDGVVATA